MPRTRRPKLDINTIRDSFAKEGDKLLTSTYLGTKQVLVYKCGKCKNVKTTVYNNYSRGYRCSTCFIKRQINPDGKTMQKIVLRSKHYSMTDVCNIFGFDYNDFRYHVVNGLLPSPTTKIASKSKLYYTEKDLQKIRDCVYLEGDKLL